MPSRVAVEAWIATYERAWRTEGTESLGELFTEDATYRMSPYEEPATGLAAIAALWEREREVRYLKPGGAEYRDLWIVRFAPDGRCREFEECPFFPGQPLADRAS